ncbi:MAG: serine/threonine-protein kinase [candidate division Zixibacteria bacterium]|nr:serine/threonine-protein kinase [candidate division Zixibacteria bacterium]
MSRYFSQILFLLVTIFIVVLYINDFGPIDRLQRSANDLLCKFTATNESSQNVVIVNIDKKSQTQYGQWPWDRDLVADLIAAVGTAEPKSIAVNLDLPEDAQQDSAGHTDILASQFRWVTQAVLQYDIALSNFRSSKTNNPPNLFQNSITVNNPVGLISEESGLSVRKVFLPAEKLLAHKPKLGFDFESPDDDRTLRHQTLFMNYDGYYYPSMSLLAAATFLGVPTDQIKVVDGESVLLSLQRKIPINSWGEYFISFAEGNSFTTYSASEVLSEGFDFKRLKGKMVLIGVEDDRENEMYSSAVHPKVSSMTIKASVIDNIINNNMVSSQSKSPLRDLLLLFFLGGIGAFVLPRILLMHRIVLLLGGFVVLMNVSYFQFASFHILPQTIYLALQLAAFLILAPMLDSKMLAGSKRAIKSAIKPKFHRSGGHDVISQPPVREFRNTKKDREEQQTSALPFDSSKSKDSSNIITRSEIYDHQAISGETKDASSSRKTASGTNTTESFDPQGIELEDSPMASNSPMPSKPFNIENPASNPDDSDKLSFGMYSQPELKNLGRYQVVGTLGRGAMGLVYKGIDPAINRPVALKTIRLDFVNDPAEMAELKERLYREAQAAGKLSHPNIVTIYDVGSEGQLQYIAMEFLQGQTLEDLIKKKTKFNYRIIAQIISQICNALDYAHDKGIVHRDIKPANIMILKDYSVKVMDYGIARIDSNSMTKTGIAMGTPNYIAPEQLKGMTTDRRADLFSLGVVMYEMLLGRRPFKGESITALIYSVINHDPEKPSNINPQVPLLFDHIIAKALKKDPAQRYQKASDITTDLVDFLAAFAQRQN